MSADSPEISDHLLTRLYAFTARYEGAVNHMYLDSAEGRANVTAGVGFLLSTVEDAKALPFDPADQVEPDFKAVKAAPPGRLARFYKALTRSRLPADSMYAEFSRRVRAMAKSLYQGGYLFDTYPEAATIAVLDMAYNLGARALVTKWPSLRAACVKRDWRRAAAECTRRGIQPERNRATAALFLEAASNGLDV